jgi:tyrosine-protein kinase Etk/Wzc
MKRREAELQAEIGSASQELQTIPARSIEEMRLRRNVSVSEHLYTQLKSRFAEADLSEKGALPDISILDSAVAPLRPATNTASRIVAIAFFASIALAIAIALLLDQLDRRFRYPEQARDELGLEVIGFVPTIRRRRDGSTDPFEAAQVVEAFRAIRLHLTHSLHGQNDVVLTVTGPGEGDGKSLVASNLAMSFAEAGYRTLLVDGDVRRGALHSTFGVAMRPGLLDFLGGKADFEMVLRSTTYENLSLVTSGEKHRRGPELLTSPRLNELLAAARGRFDVVIVDSAPLGAGIDAYALGVATGSALIVLRSGHTDRKLANVKLQLADRLPVHLLGAVLNDVRSEGTYQYYSYLEGYTSQYEQEAKSLVASTADVSDNGNGTGPSEIDSNEINPQQPNNN